MAIRPPSCTDDIVVVENRLCLERPACRVRAWPDHQFSAEIGQPLPNRRPVHIKAYGEADPPEVCIINLDLFAGNYFQGHTFLLPDGVNLVVNANRVP